MFCEELFWNRYWLGTFFPTPLTISIIPMNCKYPFIAMPVQSYLFLVFSRACCTELCPSKFQFWDHHWHTNRLTIWKRGLLCSRNFVNTSARLKQFRRRGLFAIDDVFCNIARNTLNVEGWCTTQQGELGGNWNTSRGKCMHRGAIVSTSVENALRTSSMFFSDLFVETKGPKLSSCR